MTDKRLKRPRDPIQLGKLIGDILTGQVEDRAPDRPEDSSKDKDPAAVALGRKGGLKGGKARAANMTPERRAEVARKAAQARWGHNRRLHMRKQILLTSADIRRWQDEIQKAERAKAEADAIIADRRKKIDAAMFLDT
jgi:hypothetical protein